jgi:hypothetical protein
MGRADFQSPHPGGFLLPPALRVFIPDDFHPSMSYPIRMGKADLPVFRGKCRLIYQVSAPRERWILRA